MHVNAKLVVYVICMFKSLLDDNSTQFCQCVMLCMCVCVCVY